MFKLQKCWYKFKDFYSFRGLILVILFVSLYVRFILPTKLYAFDVLDRHYFGFFNEMEPPQIKTTRQKEHYKKHGLPFVTPQEVVE